MTTLPQVGVETSAQSAEIAGHLSTRFHRERVRLGMISRGRVGCLNADDSALPWVHPAQGRDATLRTARLDGRAGHVLEKAAGAGLHVWSGHDCCFMDG